MHMTAADMAVPAEPSEPEHRATASRSAGKAGPDTAWQPERHMAGEPEAFLSEDTAADKMVPAGAYQSADKGGRAAAYRQDYKDNPAGASWQVLQV